MPRDGAVINVNARGLYRSITNGDGCVPVARNARFKLGHRGGISGTEAFALLNAPVQEVSVTPLPVKAKRKIAKRVPPSPWTAYRPVARAEALPAGW
jgi:hypothetical protein